jgi:DNA (cytosine-5)-methyltransferase 1
MMRSVELFSGCGGLALGLARAGFHHELLIEWNEDAVATVLHNKSKRVRHIRDWPISRADVRSIQWSKFGGRLDLVAGGPPCQPFSIAGKHRGEDDARDMWPEAIRAVRESLPRAFLFENVRGIARPAFASYLSWIRAHLSRPQLTRQPDETVDEHFYRISKSRVPAIYDVEVYQVNAADFGAPQKRHRIIVVGIRRDQGFRFKPLSATHSRERLLWDQWVSGDYWKRHELVAPTDEPSDRVDRAIVASLRSSMFPPTEKPWVTVRDALVGLGEPNGKRNHVFQAGARIYAGHTGSPLDQPAKALKAGDHGVPGGENMMVRDDGTVRYFTLRESARLQGLPDSYAFPGSWSESMRQLGNAVPSQLAESVGCWLAGELSCAPRVRLAA